MKRGKPLKAKAPLKGSSLQRGGRMTNRVRVRPMSDKRTQAMEVRRRLVVALLTEFPRCQIQVKCQGARSVDVHERLKRSRGGVITDPIQAHMVTACRACHDWTEAEPRLATERRMLLPSWHVCPPVGPC